jgi:hypothetical protein
MFRLFIVNVLLTVTKVTELAAITVKNDLKYWQYRGSVLAWVNWNMPTIASWIALFSDAMAYQVYCDDYADWYESQEKSDEPGYW